jgi:hypothetical protein
MPQAGFKPTIPVLGRAKKDLAATVTRKTETLASLKHWLCHPRYGKHKVNLWTAKHRRLWPGLMEYWYWSTVRILQFRVCELLKLHQTSSGRAKRDIWFCQMNRQYYSLRKIITILYFGSQRAVTTTIIQHRYANYKG